MAYGERDNISNLKLLLKEIQVPVPGLELRTPELYKAPRRAPDRWTKLPCRRRFKLIDSYRRTRILLVPSNERQFSDRLRYCSAYCGTGFILLQSKMMVRSPNKPYASNPDLTSEQDNSLNATLRHKRKQPDCEIMEALASMQSNFATAFQELRSDLGTKIDNITSSILSVRNDLENYQAVMRKDLDYLRSEQTNMKGEIGKLSSEVSDLQVSTQFISDQHDDLKRTAAECSKLSSGLLQCGSSLSSLELKMDALEQQGRLCNLEIQNLPEKSNENLINLIVTIGEKIKCTINRSDIIALHRVRHAAATNKPKHIIVKLASRVLRDNVLAAYRAKRGLTSTDIGIPGAPHILYINEHLTLRRKKLFRAVREAAKQANYKYKWISNATILVRASDTSPIIGIHTENDIAKIKKREDATPSTSQAR